MTPQAQAALTDYLTRYPELAAREEELKDLFEQWDPHDPQPSISCRKGWIDLVLSTHKALKTARPNYRLDCVKEKFGLLRIYTDSYLGFSDLDHLYDPSRLAFDAIINHSEYLSAYICENCGATIRTRGMILSTIFSWQHTFCYQCEIEYTDMQIEKAAGKTYMEETIQTWAAYRVSLLDSIAKYEKILRVSKE